MEGQEWAGTRGLHMAQQSTVEHRHIDVLYVPVFLASFILLGGNGWIKMIEHSTGFWLLVHES